MVIVASLMAHSTAPSLVLVASRNALPPPLTASSTELSHTTTATNSSTAHTLSPIAVCKVKTLRTLNLDKIGRGQETLCLHELQVLIFVHSRTFFLLFNFRSNNFLPQNLLVASLFFLTELLLFCCVLRISFVFITIIQVAQTNIFYLHKCTQGKL